MTRACHLGTVSRICAACVLAPRSAAPDWWTSAVYHSTPRSTSLPIASRRSWRTPGTYRRSRRPTSLSGGSPTTFIPMCRCGSLQTSRQRCTWRAPSSVVRRPRLCLHHVQRGRQRGCHLPHVPQEGDGARGHGCTDTRDFRSKLLDSDAAIAPSVAHGDAGASPAGVLLQLR